MLLRRTGTTLCLLPRGVHSMTALFPFKAVPSRDRNHADVFIQNCSHAVCTVTKFFQFMVCLRGAVTTLFPLKAVPSQCRNIAVYCTLKAVPIVL